MPKFAKTKFFLKKYLHSILWGALLFAVLTGLVLFSARKAGQPTSTLNQEELVKLVKPSVVRIVQHFSGEAKLANLKVDIAAHSITLDPAQPQISKTIDDYISGSGFIVNSDGYILTNAHVASAETVKQLYIDELLKSAFFDQAENLSQDDLKKYFGSENDLSDFVSRLTAQVKQNSSFQINSSLFVLNPTASQESLQGLLQNSYKAQRISVNDNYSEDEKDIALLKIDARNLPALRLGESEGVTVGNKIYIFGFPVTAEFNQRSPLESTFTQGIISAAKFSQNKSFKVFQTDAKISQGSSGGPLFNGQGEVVGIITFETGSGQRHAGDNFAFAIPLNLAKKVLADNNVSAGEGNYSIHLKTALALLHANNCKQAISEFQAASKSDTNFGTDKYLNPYIQQCEDLISKGDSVDNTFARWKVFVKSFDSFTWFVILGRILLVLGAALVLWELLSRLRKDEAEINELAIKIEEAEGSHVFTGKLESRGVQLPLPTNELHSQDRLNMSIAHPHIVDYIKEAREVGLSDDMARAELSRVGWDAEEINQAFKQLI